MTLNILEPERQINDFEDSDIVTPRRLDTEEKRIVFLKDMIDTMKKNSGTFDGPPGFLDVLSQSLCDNLPISRCLALDILCGIIPGYTGNQVDMLFPQLLQNLLHNNTSVKKATLQVLHLYFKYSQDKSIILDFLIKYGIKSDKKSLQTEVFLAMPALVRCGFTQKQLESIFESVLSAGFSVSDGESSLPIVLCLEHVKDEMGESQFLTYFNSLDRILRNLYKKIVKLCLSYHHESSKSSRSSEGVQSHAEDKEENDDSDKIITNGIDTNDGLVFGFVPNWIISKLDNGTTATWQERSDVINEFLAIVSTHVNDEAMKINCGELLKYLCVLIEDLNFNVSLISLTILHKVIVKVGPAIRFHLDMILKALVKKLHDPKLVVKKINLRIALSLMHSVTPKVFIQNILPLLKHKSARVREEILNMITAALLSFPSSYFDLTRMPSQFSFTLLDPKRRVRHASLECLAILAQKLGSGKLTPLVTAIDKIENGEGGKGVLAAVQARLARRILPRINDEGYVQYALSIPTGPLQIETIPLDIAWVVAGTTSDPTKQIPEKRYFSAGKKKLPWQNEEGSSESPSPRKDMGSAPTRKGLTAEEPPTSHVNVPVVRDTWVTDSILANKQTNAFQQNKFVSKSPKPVENHHESDQLLQKDSSYFAAYKTKMKKFKAAGLQANAQMINSIHPNMAFRNSLTSDIDQKYLKDMLGNKKSLVQPKGERSSSNDLLEPLTNEQFPSTSPTTDETGSPTAIDQELPQYTPIPLKPTLARSASKRRIKIRSDEKRQDSQSFSNHSDLGSQTYPTLKGKQEKQRSTRGGGHSPFPLKPTIHRTPSGKMNIKPILGINNGLNGGSSNLKGMSEYSFSSPNLSRLSNHGDDASPILRNDSCSPTIRTSSPRIKDPLLRNKLSNSGINANHKDNNVDLSNDDLIDDSYNPKLAKSAQEKLRKLKEERLRHSVDVGSVQNKKEKRLSRSLDFKIVGLVDDPTNGTDISVEKNTYSDLPDQYLRKNKINRTLKGKQSKTKAEKPKDTSLDDLYDSIQISNSSISKPKDNKNSNDINGISTSEKNMHKAKELKDYNERLQLDLSSVKSYDTSEASLSPNTTYNMNSSYGNSTPGNSTNGYSNSSSKNTSPRNMTFDKSSPDRTEDMLEVKGASVFDTSSEQTDLVENDIKQSRKMEKKKKAKKKQSDVSNDVNGNNELKGRRPHRSAPDKYPVAASSPMCRRKNISSVDGNNNYVEPLVSSNSFSNDLSKELPNPQQSVSTVLDSLRSDEWENKCDGLFTIRRLAIFHSEYLNQDFHKLVEAVLNEVKNLRSQVTRAALGCIADLFANIPKLVEPELELMLNTVLLKASDTNHFIRLDVEEALKKLIENVQSQKAMAAIIATGINHRNAVIRKVFGKYLADLSEKIGSLQLKSTHKDIVAVAAKLAVDPAQEARYHGRRILFLLMEDPDFDKLLTKEVPGTNLRSVQDIVENLKNKGLDPPTESAKRSSRNGFIPYSNRGSEVIKNTRGSEIIKNTSQSMKDGEVENGSANSKRGSVDSGTPEKQRRKPSSKDLHAAQNLDLECLKKLDSNNWSDRYEGLDEVYDLICTKPNEASANVMKIFDKFCPRLADPNSKVNLYALQTLNRCIPILRNSMSSATTLVIDNLKTSLASKNEAIYQSAKESLNSLVKYVDNVYLLQPLCTTVQYSNVRNKPEFAECLADIINPVYSRKPSLVSRLVLPVIWNFLSTTNSGVSQAGRANLQHAMSRICKTLYQCLGKELLVEAESKGVRAAQKLEIMLQ